MEEVIRQAAKHIIEKYKVMTHVKNEHTYVLSGGSLSNVVYNLYHNNEMDNNFGDIDIFVDYIPKECSIQSYMLLSNSNNEVVGRVYSERKRLINLVYGEYSSYSEKPIHEYIIETFDLNCVMVSYNITTDEVYYNDKFVEFIENDNIYITKRLNNNYLFRLYRYLKYIDRYNVTPDNTLIQSYVYSSKYDRGVGLNNNIDIKLIHKYIGYTFLEKTNGYYIPNRNYQQKIYDISNSILIDKHTREPDALVNDIAERFGYDYKTFTFNNLNIYFKKFGNTIHYDVDIISKFKNICLPEGFFDYDIKDKNLRYKINNIIAKTNMNSVYFIHIPDGITLIDIVNLIEMYSEFRDEVFIYPYQYITYDNLIQYINNRDIMEILIFQKYKR